MMGLPNYQRISVPENPPRAPSWQRLLAKASAKTTAVVPLSRGHQDSGNPSETGASWCTNDNKRLCGSLMWYFVYYIFVSIYLHCTEILRYMQKFQMTHLAFKIMRSENKKVLGLVLIQSHGDKDMIKQMKATKKALATTEKRIRLCSWCPYPHSPFALKETVFFCQPVIGASKASSLDVEMGRATLSSQKNWTKKLRDLFASYICLSLHDCIKVSFILLHFCHDPRFGLEAPPCSQTFVAVPSYVHEAPSAVPPLRNWKRFARARVTPEMPYHPKHQNSPASQKKLRGGWGTCRAKRWVKRAASSKRKWPTLRPQKLPKPREERTLGQGPQGASSAPFDPKSNSSRPDAATLAVPAACILCNKHHCTCIDPKKNTHLQTPPKR